MRTTPGRYLIQQALPDRFKQFDGALDAKAASALFTQMAKELSPEEYKQVTYRLNNLGNTIASEYGGVASIHLRDLRLPDNLRAMRDALQKKVYAISQDPRLSSQERKRAIIRTVQEATPAIDKAVLETLGSTDNSFGLQVKTGVRGKPQQLRQLVFGDLLSVDSKHRDIPVPTFRSYGEGITPLQYWVASHGGRQGYIGVQKATADAGYFSKMIRQAAHKQVVTADDCGHPKPFTVDTDDEDNIGSLLYRDVKGKSGRVYRANTPITADMLDDLPDRIQIRSAAGCTLGEGVCAYCAGIREGNKLPDIGDRIGLNAVNSFLESLTQGGLCLLKGTLVKMDDGTVKAIEDIQPGDCVIAADRHGRPFSAPVAMPHHNGFQDVYHTTLRRGNEMQMIQSTKDHKVAVFNVRTTEYSVLPLDQIADPFVVLPVSADPDAEFRAELGYQVESQIYYGRAHTYDIELRTEDHLFVLANGLIVSNSSKHGGGESVGAKRIKRGLEAVDQFINMPDNFVGGAVIADADGVVGMTRTAPQGGQLLTVGDREYHIPVGQQITAKRGDQVEAGDLLTDGMPNMRKIVEYKGIGEGRREFVRALTDLLRQNGAGTLRRNIEAFARGYVNKVEVTDPDGLQGWLVGDIADYNLLESRWKPREGAEDREPSAAIGTYLERPVLHYSIGTRVTPSTVKTLQDAGVSTISVNQKEPPFRSLMVPARTFSTTDDDWLVALSGENLMRSVQQHVQHGSDTKKDSISYYPRLAFMQGTKPDLLQVD